MNQGRIWCVVSPTVGLPLLLGSVTLISLTVHGVVLSNATWMQNFYEGKHATTTALAAPASSELAGASAPGNAVKAMPAKLSVPATKASLTPASQVVASAVPSGSSPPSSRL